jgi:acetolactate synthase-1/2/3 large subunit
MGGGIPAAVGASLEMPAAPVVAVVGDAGALMSAGDLQTLGRVGGHTLIVVFNDSTLSSIRRKQELAKYRPAGIDTGKANFARVAEGFGIQGFRATSQTEVAKAVESWKGQGSPCLLDVVVDFAHYRPMGY